MYQDAYGPSESAGGRQARLRGAIALLATGMLLGTAPAAAAAGGASQSEWPLGGQNLFNWRNQAATTISARNVAGLKVKWIFTTGGDVVATPAVVAATVYFPDFAGNYFAVDAETGAAKWSTTVAAWTGIADDYARDYPAVDGDKLILGDEAGANAQWNGSRLSGAGARVVAVDRNSGKVIWVSLVDPFPAAFVTSSPTVLNGVVYVGVASGEESLAAISGYPCCISRGNLVALDETTGRIIWRAYTVPDNHGALGGYSGGGVWDSTPVVDASRGLVYVGTGNNYSVPEAVEDCRKAHPNSRSCTDPKDYFDSVIALDLHTGAVKWDRRALSYDAWNVACISVPAGGDCPSPHGPDYDFGGAGPNLLAGGNVARAALGIGEKSGVYWALNPDDGSLLWKTAVGPGSSLGGVEWGTAFDGTRIYVPIANPSGVAYTLQPDGARANGGSWAALDPATGSILWQTGAPGTCTKKIPGVTQGCMALGPASVGNGVVFVGSMDTNPAHPTMFGLDAATGAVLWSHVPGSSVIAAPAIVGDSIYWGAGYRRFGSTIGTGNNKLFSFSVGGAD